MPRRFTIGREKTCDVALSDDSVSRLHAEIWVSDDGKLMMADRGSSNGTMLIRANQAVPLKLDAVLPGDQVRLGAFTLAVMDLIEAIELKNPGAFTAPDE
jgi:pSer/pThr/pTyr-binding forkhead associated (FHA) protein